MTDHPTPLRATPDQRVATPSGADVAFGDLICADTGLLHDEFDAIIAANFPVGGGQPSRRPPRHTRPTVTDRPRRPARRQPATTAPSPASNAPAGGTQMPLSRQRSPPRDNQATEIDSHVRNEEVINRQNTSARPRTQSRAGHHQPCKPAVGVLTTRRSAAAPPRHTTLVTRAASSS